MTLNPTIKVALEKHYSQLGSTFSSAGSSRVKVEPSGKLLFAKVASPAEQVLGEAASLRALREACEKAGLNDSECLVPRVYVAGTPDDGPTGKAYLTADSDALPTDTFHHCCLLPHQQQAPAPARSTTTGTTPPCNALSSLNLHPTIQDEPRPMARHNRPRSQSSPCRSRSSSSGGSCQPHHQRQQHIIVPCWSYEFRPNSRGTRITNTLRALGRLDAAQTPFRLRARTM
ncbi:hypothetical protein V8E36_006616 [Tilletia maclaganii]